MEMKWMRLHKDTKVPKYFVLGYYDGDYFQQDPQEDISQNLIEDWVAAGDRCWYFPLPDTLPEPPKDPHEFYKSLLQYNDIHEMKEAIKRQLS